MAAKRIVIQLKQRSLYWCNSLNFAAFEALISFILLLTCRQALQDQPDNPRLSCHNGSRITAQNNINNLEAD